MRVYANVLKKFKTGSNPDFSGDLLYLVVTCINHRRRERHCSCAGSPDNNSFPDITEFKYLQKIGATIKGAEFQLIATGKINAICLFQPFLQTIRQHVFAGFMMHPPDMVDA